MSQDGVCRLRGAALRGLRISDRDRGRRWPQSRAGRPSATAQMSVVEAGTDTSRRYQSAGRYEVLPGASLGGHSRVLPKARSEPPHAQNEEAAYTCCARNRLW